MGSFRKASKSQSRLRCAAFGPSGSGKTFSCLRIATGLGGTIAVIDSERGSASKYADRFAFDVCDLEDKTIAGYSRMIKEAGGAGYDILIIDSLSHAWQELLEEVDALAKTKYRGNTWSAWSEGTPKQRRLIDAILDFPGHVLATMRSKTEWQTTKDERGKNTPQRIGLAPEQGKGIEYEFDLLLEITPEHYATVIKDRTGKFQDIILDKPGERFGEELAAWLSDGVAAEAATRQSIQPDDYHPPKAAPREANGRGTGNGRTTGESAASGHEGARNGAKPAHPPAESWHAFATYALKETNENWTAEMEREGVEAEARKKYTPLTDINRLINYLCSLAIEKGFVANEDATKADKPDARDPGKAKVAVETLFTGRPKGTKAAVAEYLKTKRREARADLGMFDPDAEDDAMGEGADATASSPADA